MQSESILLTAVTALSKVTEGVEWRLMFMIEGRRVLETRLFTQLTPAILTEISLRMIATESVRKTCSHVRRITLAMI